MSGQYQDGQNVWYEYSSSPNIASVISSQGAPVIPADADITIPSTITVATVVYDVTSISSVLHSLTYQIYDQ